MQAKLSNLSLFDVFTAAKLKQSLHSSTDHLQRQSKSLQPSHQIICRQTETETLWQTLPAYVSIIPLPQSLTNYPVLCILV